MKQLLYPKSTGFGAVVFLAGILIFSFLFQSLAQTTAWRGLKFNGNNYLDCGNPSNNLFDFTGEGTIEAWVKLTSIPPTADGTRCYTILAKDESAGDFNKWIFGVQNGKLAFHINSPDQNHDWTYSDPFVLQINKYYFFAITKDSSNKVSFYVNGADKGTYLLPHNITIVDAPLTIGGSEAGLSMNGEICAISFWRKKLTLSQINQWMFTNQTSAHLHDGRIKALFRLKNGIGQVIDDIGGVKGVVINKLAWANNSTRVNYNLIFLLALTLVTVTGTIFYLVRRVVTQADLINHTGPVFAPAAPTSNKISALQGLTVKAIVKMVESSAVVPIITATKDQCYGTTFIEFEDMEYIITNNKGIRNTILIKTTGNTAYVCREIIKDFEKKLPLYFVRIKESDLVNIKKITYRINDKVLFIGDQRFDVSKNHRQLVHDKIVDYMNHLC